MNHHVVWNPTLALSEVADEIRRRLRREKAKLLVFQAIVFLLAVAFIIAI
jgi:hypothetical protein